MIDTPARASEAKTDTPQFERPGTIQIVRSIAGLEALEWNDLLERCEHPNVFQRWEWIRSWLATVGAKHEIWTHVARDARGKLVGIAPLAIARRRFAGALPFRRLEFLGSEDVSADHLDFLVDREAGEAVYRALVQSVVRRKQRWDVLRVEGLSNQSVLPAELARALPGHRQEVNSRDFLGCHYVQLPGTWEELRKQLSKNLRHGMERQGRRLEGSGKLVFREIADADSIEPFLGPVMRLHQEIQTSRGNAGSFDDPAIVEFHRRIAGDFQRSGILRIYLLELDGEPIAGLYGYRYGDVFSSYSTGYRLDLAQYGPGRQVLWYAIRQMIAEGAEIYDHLRGDEGYKQGWSDLVRQDFELVQSSGFFGDAMLAATPRLRKLRDVARSRLNKLRSVPNPEAGKTEAAERES